MEDIRIFIDSLQIDATDLELVLRTLFQAREDDMGIVVDEFVSAIGIITTEDILGEVVGEIDVGYAFDEYHAKRRMYIEHESGDIHLMGGRTPTSEVNDILHLSLPAGEAQTLGGLIGNRLRCIPNVGDFIEERGAVSRSWRWTSGPSSR